MPSTPNPVQFKSEPLAAQPASGVSKLPKFSGMFSNRVLKILIGVALFLVVVTILVFWFGGSSFSERNVQIKLEGPQQALSGDEVTYKLTYENHTRTKLEQVKFRFTFPDNSIVIHDGEYSGDTVEELELDSIPAGQTGVREFRAFLVGDKGSILYAKAEMAYRAGGLNSRFDKKPISVATTIVGMPVPITLSVPPTAVSGQEISYTLDYRNDSASDIADLRFTFTYPNGFTPKRFSPQPTAGTNVWVLPLLKKGNGNRIIITGTLVGNERDTKEVSMIVQRKINDTYINYEQAQASTLISSPLMNVKVAVNGSRDYIASPGDFLTYSVTYRNTSTYTFSGLSLLVKLEGEMYDFSTIDTANGFFDDATQTIIWNGASIPELSNFGPAAGGKTEFRIRLKPSFGSGALGSKNFFVKSTATLITPDVPTGLDGDSVSTQDALVTKISTQPSVNQSLYYNDASFGSSGPLPPQVGTETVFTVHWQLANPGNSMNNVIVKATLPTGITWKNVTSAPSNLPAPTYDRNKGQVIWNLGAVSSGIGTLVPKYEVSFQIGITPSSAQRGDAPVLLRAGSLSGTDSFTGQSIIVNLEELTTNDTTDRSGSGTVQ